MSGCRICLSRAGPLVESPCNCNVLVHKTCLLRWIHMSPFPREICEVCHANYRWQIVAPQNEQPIENESERSVFALRDGVLYPLHVYIENQLIDAR